MRKAGDIVGLIAGIFGMLAALATLAVGGMGSAFNADGASTVVYLGWGGIAFSFLTIVLGAVAMAVQSKIPGIMLIVSAIAGAILGGTLVAICMILALLGGVLAVIGSSKGSIAPATA
jgi:hypothetical protein